MNLEAQIESVLFYKNEPVSLRKLCVILEKSEQEVREALGKLRQDMASRGLELVQHQESYMLSTSQANAELIDRIAKDELSRDIGKAGLETLAIILYKGEASRREIDYVRGVNSTFILRSLLARGLVERKEGEGSVRTFHYQPTLALLAHLGLKQLEDLPEYAAMRKEIENIDQTERENQEKNA